MARRDAMKWGNTPIRLEQNTPTGSLISWRDKNYIQFDRDLGPDDVTTTSGFRDLNTYPRIIPSWAVEDTYQKTQIFDREEDLSNQFFSFQQSTNTGRVKAPFGFLISSVVFENEETPVPVAATLTIEDPLNTRAGIVITADTAGADGNDIEIIIPAVTGSPVDISRVGNTITVNDWENSTTIDAFIAELNLAAGAIITAAPDANGTSATDTFAQLVAAAPLTLPDTYNLAGGDDNEVIIPSVAPLTMVQEATFTLPDGTGNINVVIDYRKADVWHVYRSNTLSFASNEIIGTVPNGSTQSQKLLSASIQEMEYNYNCFKATKTLDLTYYYKIVGAWGITVPTSNQIATYPVRMVHSAEETTIELAYRAMIFSGSAYANRFTVDNGTTYTLDFIQLYNRPLLQVKIETTHAVSVTLNNVNNNSIQIAANTTFEYPIGLTVLRLIIANASGSQATIEVSGMVPLN